jgi:hypothetical protein
MKLHRILYKLYGSEKEANRDLKKLIDEIPTAFIEQSQTSGHWVLYLFASEYERQTQKFLKQFKDKKMEVFYQYK